MRVETDHGERLRTVLAGQPAPRRGPRRALLEPDATDDLPTVRRVLTLDLPPPPLVVAAPNTKRVPRDEPVAAAVAEEAASAPGGITRIRAFTRRHLQAIGLLAVLALVFTSVQLLRARPSEVPVVIEPGGPPVVSSAPAQTPSAPAMLQVHVLGAVMRPGVVRVPAGARVHDAIEAAGGLTGRAHLGSLNLAAPVSDGMQVLVADSAQQTSTTSPDGGATGQPPGSSGGVLINLNTATQAQLESLPGVGPATASKILAWRDEHGKFNRIEELQEIDGIGAKTFDRLKPLVTV